MVEQINENEDNKIVIKEIKENNRRKRIKKKNIPDTIKYLMKEIDGQKIEIFTGLTQTTLIDFYS